MSIASNITALVTAIANAINSRGAAGPSDYQMWLAAGNTGDMAAYRTAILGGDFDWATQFNTALGAPTSASADTLALFSGERRGTNAQRLALTGAQLFDGLMFNTTDTGLTWRYFTSTTNGFRTGAGWVLWEQPVTSVALTYTGTTNVTWTATKRVERGLRVATFRGVSGASPNWNACAVSIGDAIDLTFPMTGVGALNASTNRFWGLYVRYNGGVVGQFNIMLTSQDSGYLLNNNPIAQVAGDNVQFETRYRVLDLQP